MSWLKNILCCVLHSTHSIINQGKSLQQRKPSRTSQTLRCSVHWEPCEAVVWSQWIWGETWVPVLSIISQVTPMPRLFSLHFQWAKSFNSIPSVTQLVSQARLEAHMPNSKDTVFVLSLRKISCLLHWDTVFVEKCKDPSCLLWNSYLVLFIERESWCLHNYWHSVLCVKKHREEIRHT